MEGAIPIQYGNDAVEIPGSRKLLATIEANNVPWAVVTSGTRALIDGWIKVLKLAHPKTLVVAEDVDKGKPHPACYLLGRDKLGLGSNAQLVVIEDAPSGVQAGKAAGFKVIGLVTTHSIAQIKDAGADWIVPDLRSVSVKSFEHGSVQIAIDNALVED